MRFRHVARAATASAAALALPLPTPAAARVPGLDALPIPDTGAVGELLDPVGDLVDEILGAIDPGLVDLPLDNAVRLTAEDAVDAAVALSQATFATSDTAFLARDDVFADTLSSVSAQGIAGAPLLLTQTDGIDDRVAAELDRLGAEEIIILGNEAAISDAVEADLIDQGFDVDRAGGETRIETAIEVAEMVAPDADTAILLRAYPSDGAPQSQAYSDALSAGPFGSLNGYPVLLTGSEDIHPATMDYIEGSAIENIVVIGGENAIAESITDLLASLLDSVSRIAGSNRAATAIAVAEAMGFDNASDPSRIILTEVAAGEEPLWAAGYAAAAHAAVFEAPVIAATGAVLPPETLLFLLEGLLDNALRLSNEPLICNSFVNLLACETAALLMVGLLDEVNQLTGGVLEDILGAAGLADLIDMLSGILPGADGLSPALLEELLGVLSLPGGGGLDALSGLPQVLQDSLLGLLGTEGARPSTSRQAVQTDLLRQFSAMLGDASVNTSDPTQAAALADVLTGIGGILGDDAGQLPLGEAESLLEGVAVLVQQVLGAVDLGDLGGLVGGLGIDGLAPVADVLDVVAGLLATGGDASQLTDLFGAGASGLAEQVGVLQSLGL